jgi:hypothetical protein
MKKSFAQVKVDLEEACTFLRSFTLGRHGFTPSDGVAGIERVNSHCDRLDELFSSGPNAKEAATIAAKGRACVTAAQARLAYLRAN